MSDEKLYRWVRWSDRRPLTPGKYITKDNKNLLEYEEYLVQDLANPLLGSFSGMEWLEEVNPQPGAELKAEEKILEQHSTPKTNENI